ncbi:MAG: glcB [Acidimicrobiaceae bacterium]|nr:glcB [Acidimicrobiaceae bacterium]
MAERVAVEGLGVDPVLHRFLVEEALPCSGVEPTAFWRGLARFVADKSGRNRQLLERRAELQRQIDGWHLERRGHGLYPAAYREMLESIGYLDAEGPDFHIETSGVDPEIAELSGPQLVLHAARREEKERRSR